MTATQRTCLVFFVAMMLGGAASAGQVQGTVFSWELDPAGNFSFILNNAPVLCTNGHFDNNRGAVVAGVRGVTTDGVKAMYASMLAAFLAGKQITVYTDETVVTSGWGCTVYVLDVTGP